MFHGSREAIHAQPVVTSIVPASQCHPPPW